MMLAVNKRGWSHQWDLCAALVLTMRAWQTSTCSWVKKYSKLRVNSTACNRSGQCKQWTTASI